jgi:hypothetical protein
MVELEPPASAVVLSPGRTKPLVVLNQDRFNRLMTKNLSTGPKAAIMTDTDFTTALGLPAINPKRTTALFSIKGQLVLATTNFHRFPFFAIFFMAFLDIIICFSIKPFGGPEAVAVFLPGAVAYDCIGIVYS